MVLVRGPEVDDLDGAAMLVVQDRIIVPNKQIAFSGCILQLARGQISVIFGRFSTFPDVLVAAIGFVSSRCTGWTDSRLQTSILRHRSVST